MVATISFKAGKMSNSSNKERELLEELRKNLIKKIEKELLENLPL